MAVSKKNDPRKHTYSEYLHWTDNERWEILDGIAYQMTPSPSRQHQAVLRELTLQIGNYLKGKVCEMYMAPFDVRLAVNGEADPENVVKPDLIVVCDHTKLDERGCNGAPDLIVEILSPGTAKRDMFEKLELYQKAGVKEYWIVHPTDKTIIVYVLGDNGRYDGFSMYNTDDGELKAAAIGNMVIDLTEVFTE